MTLVYVGIVLFSVLVGLRARLAWRRRQLQRQWRTAPLGVVEQDHCFGYINMVNLVKHTAAGTYYENSQRIVDANPQLKTLSMYVAGQPVIVTLDPENIKAMLATQFTLFHLGKRHLIFYPLLGNGVFTLDGEGWKHLRQILRPQFHRDQIVDVLMFESHAHHLIQEIKNSKPGAVVDLQPLFFSLTMDVATEFLFGESVNSLGQKQLPFSELFTKAQEKLTFRFVLQDMYFLGDGPQFRKHCRTVHELADHYVERALAQLDTKTEGKYTFLNELVKQTRDPKVLRDQALNILLAGRDTTASTLLFLWYELGRNPEIYTKLKDEVDQRFAEADSVTFESLKRAPYLQQVLKEVLRMYPIVAENVRFAAEDTTLPRGGGSDGSQPIFVAKGTNITYSPWCMHRDRDVYGDDANVFRPERWVDLKNPGWAYLPFNGGPRVCLGQQFALTELALVTVRMVQAFPQGLPFSGDSTYPPLKHVSLTISLKQGCPVKVT